MRKAAEEAWRCLSRYFGSVDFGDPDGSNNDKIDADLLKDYSRGLDRDENG